MDCKEETNHFDDKMDVELQLKGVDDDGGGDWDDNDGGFDKDGCCG